MDIQDQYDRIVAGDFEDTDIKWSRRKLQLHAFDKASGGSARDRLGALRVAAFLGPTHGLPITASLVTDGDRDVRVAAFNQAVAAREDGRALLRDVLGGPDIDLAMAAADLLARAHDRPSLGIASRLVRAEDPRLRAAGARIIGLVGGRSSLAGLRPEAEPDAAVRDAMRIAVEQVTGDTPRPTAELWWSDDGELTLPSPPLEGRPVADHTAPPPAQPAAASADPAPSEPQLPSAPLSTPAPADEARPPPAEGAALPGALPTEARALCKLLGMVAPADRGEVLAALRALDPAELGDVWIAWSPGGDPAVGRGIALAAAALERKAFLSKATRMAGDAQPEVRSAALEALGALGGASALLQLQRALLDAEPAVRAAAATAVASLAVRIGRQDMARGWLQGLGDEADPAASTAIAEALERLA